MGHVMCRSRVAVRGARVGAASVGHCSGLGRRVGPGLKFSWAAGADLGCVMRTKVVPSLGQIVWTGC